MASKGKGKQTYGGFSNDENQVDGDMMKYSVSQVMLLQELFEESENPNDSEMLAMIRDNSVLSNLNPEQIKVWFKKIRCAKEFKEVLSKHKVNIAERLWMENNFLQGVVEQLHREQEYICRLINHVSVQNHIAPELPKSVLENLKMAAYRKSAAVGDSTP